MKKLLTLAVAMITTAVTTCAFAATPVAVWDGDFTKAIDGYTLNLNDNKLSDDKATVTITNQYKGLDINFTTAMTSGMTVMFRYANFAVGSNAKMLATSCVSSDYSKDRTGIDVQASGKLHGAWYNNGWVNNGEEANSVPASGYLVFTYKGGSEGGSGTYIYHGSSAANIGSSEIWGNDSLMSVYDSSIYGATVGGMRVNNDNWRAAQDMTVTAIAVFDGVLTADDMNSYAFPSDASHFGASCHASANAVYTWVSAESDSNSDFHKCNFVQSTSASNDSFTDGATVYAGNTSYETDGLTGSDLFWRVFCNYGKWKTPGSVLRFRNGSAGKSFNASFDNLTLAGLVVEIGATNFTIAATGARNNHFGNRASGTQSYFDVNEDFTINREGNTTLYGSMNVYVANGKTFDMNSGYTAKTTSFNTDTTPSLHMSGEGTMKVATLNASGATLDFSAFDVSRATPFISGNLAVDATTGWTFPSGLEADTAYKVCSGTLTPSATTLVAPITVGSVALYARLTFDTENSTVSYEEVSANQATVSSDTTWSAITNTADWVEGLPAEITLTADAEIEFDVVPDATVITLKGAYTATLVYTKTHTGTIAVDGASYEVKIPVGATDFDLSSAFTVPGGTTYILAGSSSESTTCSGAITVNGTLKTSGLLNLSGANVVSTSGAVDILDGTTTMNFVSQNNSGTLGMCGTLTVRAGATYINSLATDFLPWGGTATVNVYGTFDLASTRASISANHVLNFYAGSTITGTGSSTTEGALDFIHNVTPTVNFKQLNGSGGTVTLSARIRIRNAVNFVVEDGVTVAVSSATCSGATWGAGNKPITKTGSGTLKLASGADFISTYAPTISTGTLELDGGTIAGPITVVNGATMTATSGTASGAIANSGTVNLAGATVSGAISGTGAINVTSGTNDPTLSSATGDIAVSGDGTILYLTTSELESAGDVTVASGSVLRIVVAEAQIASGYDATSYLTNNGTVQFYTESGSQITEGVSGTVLSPAANNWATLAAGSWDSAAGWSGGVPTATSSVCLNYADAIVTISADSTAASVVVSQSATISGTAEALAAFAENISTLTIGSGVTLTLKCTDAGTYTFSQVVSGDGALAVDGGTVTLSAANTMTGGFVVKSGTLAKTTSGTGFGPQQGSVTVEDGGSLDLLNAGSGWYNLTIAGTGTANQGAVYVSQEKDAFSSGSAQLKSITLSGNATIGVSYQWGLIYDVYGATTLSLGTYTLTKIGGGNFWLCNATISGSGSFVVSEGNLALNSAGGSACVGNSANITIKDGATMTVNQYNLTIGYLVIDEGGTVTVSSGKVLTAGYLTVNGGITVPDAGGVAVNHYLYGSGTMSYGALPASAIQTFLKNSNWEGTVALPALTSNSGISLFNYGNASSAVRLTSMTAGWFFAGAVDTTVDIAGDVTNSSFSTTHANTWAKITGTGTLTYTYSAGNNSTVFWIKDVSKYAGDLATTGCVPLQLGGSSKGSAPSSDGTIEVCSGMTATIASGKTWTAAGGIIVNGTLGGAGSSASAVTVGGTLDMSSNLSLSGNVTLNNGAIIKLPEGASLPYTVTSGTLTRASGATVSVQDSTGAAISGWWISGNRIIKAPVIFLVR